MQALIAKTLHWITKYAAASYIAGPDLTDALRVCTLFAEQGLGSTICPWDGPSDTMDKVALSYKEALNAIIKKDSLNCYLSVKVPSINYDFNIITELVDIAREKNIKIHFDSMAPDTVSPSISLLEKILKNYNNIGYTLPAAWRRSSDDAEKLIDLGISLRVVKGQWPDPADPDIDLRSSFLSIIDILSGSLITVGVATHDTLLAKESLHRLKVSGTPCELEQLFGLPSRIASVAKPLGIPTRVYIPYGYAYLSYAISAMRKRPIICAWLIMDFITGVIKKVLPTTGGLI